MDSRSCPGSTGVMDGQDLSVECPSHQNFSTAQDPEPSPAHYPQNLLLVLSWEPRDPGKGLNSWRDIQGVRPSRCSKK